MRQSTYLFIMLALLCFAGQDVVSAEELYAVVAETSPVSSLSKAELKKIYKLKQARWSNGVLVYPVHLWEENALRQTFSQQVLGKSVAQMEIYYLKMALIGRGQPPHVVKNEQEVLLFVQEHEGAIGYVHRPVAISGTKLFRIL